MTKSAADFSDENFNRMKTIEADLVRNLQEVVKDPSTESKLSDAIFTDHQNWLKVIMPNYSTEIHLGIVDGYESDERYQSYYDDKAGKGATKILIKIVKDHLQK
ncbi:MAG: TipAS antibiotic-recognition domain-containing protein [Lactobacillus sp.]|nr:TipAS antibiotic-recognition domain-containing protein [Lactobacillus sp.]